MARKKIFDQNLETRVVCVASTPGLRTALKQKSKEGWAAITYASRFFKSLEKRTQ